MKLDTKIVRASSKPDKTTGAIVPPIYQTSTYVLEEVGKDKGYDYTRASNPSRELLEEHLAAIEGAKYGVCFSSGMSAVDSVLKLLKAGDHVVCSDDVYGGVSRHFNQVLVHYKLEFTYVNSSNPKEVMNHLHAFLELDPPAIPDSWLKRESPLPNNQKTYLAMCHNKTLGHFSTIACRYQQPLNTVRALPLILNS